MNNTETDKYIDELEKRLAEVEALLFCSRKPDPIFISLDEAARISGKTKRAVQNLLRREGEKPDGFQIRRIQGGVHRKDWESYLYFKASRKQTRGQIVRDALERI